MQSSKLIEFKGGKANFMALAVTLRSADMAELTAAIEEMCGPSPDFFNNDLAVLDVEGLADGGVTLDWSALVALLRRHRLNPSVVRHAAPEAAAAVRAAGLSLAEDVELANRPVRREEAMPDPAPAAVQETAEPAASASAGGAAGSGSATPAPAPAPSTVPSQSIAPPPPAPLPAAAVPTMIVDRPLRSGQQVYARGSDLVVLAMVSPGAEVIADGNIHAYAPLRGRALAGASGREDARILTTCFEAELVSVGGVYRTLEPGTPKEVFGRPAQVRLQTDPATGRNTLIVEALSKS